MTNSPDYRAGLADALAVVRRHVRSGADLDTAEADLEQRLRKIDQILADAQPVEVVLDDSSIERIAAAVDVKLATRSNRR